MYSALIVDDEKAQQDILSSLLKNHFPQFDLLSICSSVDEGIIQIMKHRPQLVFLDVEMPPKTGFDLLGAIGLINFEVIFTTSFEKYAIKAFKVSAVDFLLKPFGLMELKEALLKFEQRFNGKNSHEHIKTLLHNLNAITSEKNKIALPTINGYVFVNIADVVRCESDNTYSTFYFADKTKLLVSKTLKECEDLLSEFNFFRIHNSHLINMNFIKEYIKGEGGQVRMTDGSLVDVSRRKRDEFLTILKRL